VRGRALALAASMFASCLLARPAWALGNSELEERSVARALGPHPDRDDAPAGKRIESVEVVRLAVFDDDDPVPDFVNIFHAQTRERYIRQELLFKPGDAYDAERVAETTRNLQTLPQFGVVVVVALKGAGPGSVRLVVIVRDVWSLRLAYELQGTFVSDTRVPVPLGWGAQLSLPLPALRANYLLVNPSETNFLGTRSQLGGIFTLAPDRYSLGALAIHPRVAGSKVDALALGQVYVNVDSGKPEGSTGELAVYRDLISLSDKWAFLAGAGWTVEQTRIYSDRRLVISDEGVPLAYHTSVARGGAELTRSFGQRQKLDLTLGFEVVRSDYQATRGADTSAASFASFVQNELPVSDTRTSPFVQLQQRTTRFFATHDVETLALSESFALGQIAALRLYPALRGLGSSRDLLGSVAWLGYTWQIDSGLLRVLGSSAMQAADHARHQASAQAAARFVSPKLGVLRLVLDSALQSIYDDYLNQRVVLGGDTRPRGYASAIFRGDSGFAASAELRTSAVNILSARVGGVAFYDVGGTAEKVGDIAFHQSLGAGVRILFPQLNRQVFRLDWAAPLTPGRGRIPDRPLPGAVYFSFGQAFDLPRVKLPKILGADTSLLSLTQ
jgi:Omp85 superfamily domain